MLFENAIIMMRKGYKVCRKKNLNRMNGIYLMINKKTGELEVGQIHSNVVRRSPDIICLDVWNIIADDWMLFEGK